MGFIPNYQMNMAYVPCLFWTFFGALYNHLKKPKLKRLSISRFMIRLRISITILSHKSQHRNTSDTDSMLGVRDAAYKSDFYISALHPVLISVPTASLVHTGKKVCHYSWMVTRPHVNVC